jgi:formylglycine-generating enzyme required for sulfatase activity
VQNVSVEKAPGYYDLFISATKGSLSAGRAEKVHIYAGLESAAVFAFEDADFVQTVYLAGTLTLPAGVTSVSGGTINAYSDATYTSPIVTDSDLATDGSWLITVSAANISGSMVYLKAVVTGSDGKLYAFTGNTTVTEKGAQGITLANTTVPVTGVTLDQATLTLTVGGATGTLEAAIAPSNATDQTVTWASSDESVATVSNGVVTAVAVGTATITVTTANRITATCTVTVTQPVTNITGVPTVVVAGQTLTLTGTVAPDNATNKAIVWSVTGTTGATISGNTLTTTTAETVTVTATIANGKAVGEDYTQDFDITIHPLPTLPALTMITVPEGTVTARIGNSNGPFINASSTNPVTVDAFSIGETEITYELWKAVYDWATHADRGTAKYTFANAGMRGSDDNAGNINHPVTYISWRDAVLWCNAYSEATGKTPVYNYKGAVLRESEGNSTSAELGKAELATIDATANGFRLPTDAQWEYAVWGGDPTDATNWNYTYAGSDTVDEVAVNSGNSGGKTAEVKSKNANRLDLYDMSGNVYEWCWDKYSSSSTGRVFRGGGWSSGASSCAVAYRHTDFPYYRNYYIGFRVVCHLSALRRPAVETAASMPQGLSRSVGVAALKGP